MQVDLTRQQFVQTTWALRGVSCDIVSDRLLDPYVNNTLAWAVTSDFKAALNAAGWPEAADSVVAVRQPCATFNVNGTKYASFRVMVKFNSTNSTTVRNQMLVAVAGRSAKPCSGGYNQQKYENVAALWARGPFIVSQNSE
ncbi:hypothetical protein OEZ86_002406 [Tetradesmus obliquus]|nr:hypothetical protein OEZ86_002406 [Tetradesmus obliquus]